MIFFMWPDSLRSGFSLVLREFGSVKMQVWFINPISGIFQYDVLRENTLVLVVYGAQLLEV